MQFTVRSRIRELSIYPFIDAMSVQLSSVKRKTFVHIGIFGRKASEVKAEFLRSEKITARQFNGILFDVKALIKAQKELTKKSLQRIERKKKKIKQDLKSVKEPFKAHHLKRKKGALEFQSQEYESRLKTPSVCFGSRKFFNKQFHLKENGYSNHEEWKKDWELARSSEFYLIGSKDESFGNQSCQLLPGRLQLRLTDLMVEKYGFKTIEIPIEFTYEQERIAQALASGQAMNYRFVKSEKGIWYVHLTFKLPEIKDDEWISKKKNGSLGIDLNPSCIAVTHIDGSGNLVKSWQIPIELKGKRSEQTKAILGNEIAKLVEYAKKYRIPIVIEALDFEKKKEELRSRKMNRMLSSFAYSLFFKLISMRCYKEAIRLIEINPAYTSVIGKVKFSFGYGLSTHMGAAMAIARRGLKFGECIRAKTKVRLSLPVRNRAKHVWSDWRRINPMVFPGEYIAWKDRHRPERNQGKKLSRLTLNDSAWTLCEGFGTGLYSPLIQFDEKSPGANRQAFRSPGVE